MLESSKFDKSPAFGLADFNAIHKINCLEILRKFDILFSNNYLT